MKNYICPKCNGYLSIDNEIIFLTKNNKGGSAIVLLSAELGDYSFRKNDSVDFKSGDHVNFICPICYENLNAEEYDEKNLAKIYMVDNNGKKSDIVFSKVLGEKCTYTIHEDGIEAHGDHKDAYIDKF
ncbi:MAG: hypothetical protein LBQ22_10245 [Bacteroidales bacterium]|jgi:hypothetical protein|nr:hypothetical protein [Bacteroidales bacterium]